MFSMAESLARRGAADIEQVRWLGLQQGSYGLDGQLYSRKGAGMSLLMVPLVELGLLVPIWGVASAALLFNSLVTAATGALLCLYLQRLGYTERSALLAGLIFGLGTLAWPYAKTCFSDPLAGLCLLAAAWALLRLGQVGQARYALAAGLALALAIATRYANLALLPLFGLALLWYAWHAPRDSSTFQYLAPDSWRSRMAAVWRQRARGLARPLLAFGAPLAGAGALIAAYNLVRYGHPLETGYLPEESFSGVWWQGILGQLISPGRGLLLYTPVLWLALPTIATLWRRHRAEAIQAWSITLFHLLLYGKWFMWHGGYAWGPRFMIPALPFLVVALAPAIEWAGRVRAWRLVLWALLGLSLVVQLIGLSVHFELFQNQLLDTGLPLYAPITFFDPRYSPLIGQLAFIRPAYLDFAWMRAGQLDAALLAGLALAVLAAGVGVWRVAYPDRGGRLAELAARTAPVVVLLAGAWLLTHVHASWPEDVRQAVTTLNARLQPGDAILTGVPEQTGVFADLYKGRNRVLGLNPGDLGRDAQQAAALDRLMADYARVWWLPNWLPPAGSDIEQRLMRTGFRVEDVTFLPGAGSAGGQRLVLYYFPSQPLQRMDVGVCFAGSLCLDTVELLAEVKAGDILPTVLYWRAARSVEANYQVFVQLLDADGRRVAGSDGQPALWTRPTTSWRPGELIADRHALQLPADLAPGQYRLIAGLYLLAGGQRLMTDDGQDAVYLYDVRVGR